jgi:O-antigen/teichoic acid export membrane protein
LSEYKLFVQRIGLMGITQLLATLSTVILLPILTKNYSVSDYGIWVQITVTLNLIPSIITLGLPFSMIRFLAATKDKEEIQEGFYSISLIVVISGLIAALLLFIFSDTIAHYLLNNNIVAAKILPLVVFFSSLNVVYVNFFRTFQKMKIYSIFLILQSYLVVLFLSYFALSGYSISYTVIGLLLTQIIVFLMAFVLIISRLGFKIPKFLNIREYLSLGLPTVSSSLSYWIVDSSDRYLIGILLSTTAVGYYSPSYTLGTLIVMLVFPFNVILLPLLSQHFDNNRMDEVRIFMKYSLKFFLTIAIPSAVGLSLLSRIIIQILSTPEIAANGYFVTPFIALSALLFGIYNIIINVIVLNKKTKIIGIIWVIAAVLNIIFNLVMIPYFGILGAAVATLIAYSIAFLISVFYSAKYFRFDFELSFIGKSIAASVLMSIFIIKFYPTGILNLLIVIGVSFLIYITVLLLLKGFEKEEIDFIKTLLK